MTRTVRLADLDIEETSGVDHPAHLHEGWLVLKSVTGGGDPTEGESDLELEVTENEMVEETIVEAQSAEKAVTDGNAALLKELGDLRKELFDMRVEKERIEQEAEVAKAIEAAGAWAVLPEVDPVALGPAIVELRKALPEIAESIEAILSASALAMSEAGVLKEVGSETSENAGTVDAWGMIENRANDLVASGEASTFAKAITLVAERDKDLYNTNTTRS